jgi:hypothetical protein
MERSTALKGARLMSLDLIVDDVMKHVSPVKLDFALTEDRDKLRHWLVTVGAYIIHEVTASMEEASTKAINEAAQLFSDPEHYEKKKQTRRRREERRAKAQVERERQAAQPNLKLVKWPTGPVQ